MLGGAGDDLIAAATGDDTVAGGAGNDTIIGAAGDDHIDGGAGDDAIFAGAGDDVISGGAGADMLRGGKGDDIVIADIEDSFLSGGGDQNADVATRENGDTLDLSSVGEGVFVDLDTNFEGAPNPGLSQSGAVRNIDVVGGGEETFNIAANNFENVIGTGFDDRLFGNAEANVLEGRGGDDVFHAFAGNDIYDGGEGSDTALFVQAVVGIDADFERGTVIAGDDVNELISIENLTGGAFDDTIAGDSEDNTLVGGGGADALSGRRGADTLVGGIEDASFDGGADAAGLGGFTLQNSVNAGASIDAGGNVADLDATLDSALAGEIYFNAHSTDFPAGEVRGQLVLLEDNRDDDGVGSVIFGSTLNGEAEVQDPPVVTDSDGQGAVTFITDASGVVSYEVSLTVRGVDLNELTVLHLHNAPEGQNGPVVVDLLADAGADPATNGAPGRFIGTSFVANDLGDTLDLNGAAEGVFVDLDTSFAGAPNPGLSQTGSVRNIDVVGGGEETFNIAAEEIENVVGTDQADRLFGNAEDNTLEGRGGDDVFHAFAGNDVYDGGDGTDTALFVQAAVGVVADLEVGVSVAGTDVNQLISIENFTGGAFDDAITGSSVDNVLNGGGGVDVLTGGAGADSFQFSGDPFKGEDVSADGRQIIGGEDTITDFDFAVDQYLLSAEDFDVDQLVFQALDANADGASIAAGTNVVVLLNSDNDDDAATPFLAGTAANQIADIYEGDAATPGFFVYFNSNLELNRLVYSEDLSDATADLSIVSRQTDLTGEDAVDALAAFSADNFDLF